MPKVPTLERRARIQPIRGAGLQVEVPGIEEPKTPKLAKKLLNEIYVAETNRINEVAVLDADLQGSKIETELLYDPKIGAMNQLGKNAAAVYGPTMEEYDKRIAEIISGLTNNTQKFEAQKRSKLRRANMDRTVQRHVAVQTLQYDNETSKKWLESEKARLDKIYNDPPAVKRSIQLQQRERARFAYRNGLSVEGEEDSEWLKDAKRDVASNSHKLVIKHLIADGADRAARDYYKENKKEIFDDVQLKKDIDVASSDGLASSTVADVVTEHGPKDDNDAFNLDLMAAEIRRKLKNDDKARKLAMALLKERKTIHDASVKERADANESALWEMEGQGVQIKELLISPEYLALPGKDKKAFRVTLMRISAEDKLTQKINQENNFDMLKDDLSLARETDLNKMLERKELNIFGFRSLNKLLDPKKQPAARDAFIILKRAETNNLFDEDEEKNTKVWAEYNQMLHQFLESNPDDDPVEFVNKLMKPIEVNTVKDIIRGVWKTFGIVGGPRTLKPGEKLFDITTEEEAREEKLKRIKREAGTPRRRRKRVNVQEGAIINNPTTGERMVLKEGKWQTLGK